MSLGRWSKRRASIFSSSGEETKRQAVISWTTSSARSSSYQMTRMIQTIQVTRMTTGMKTLVRMIIQKLAEMIQLAQLLDTQTVSRCNLCSSLQRSASVRLRRGSTGLRSHHGLACRRKRRSLASRTRTTSAASSAMKRSRNVGKRL